MACSICNDTGWGCENHPDRPFNCGGSSAPMFACAAPACRASANRVVPLTIHRIIPGSSPPPAEGAGDDQLMARSNWSRPLPQAVVIPKVMTLKTLADLGTLLRHLPAGHGWRRTWRHVAAELDKAAAGADTVEVSVALRMVLSLRASNIRRIV
jgi:hypothetical protein